ncbi:MAG: 4Fe-4S dicluster domain-containing protein [Gaiellaceae bacterium]
MTVAPETRDAVILSPRGLDALIQELRDDGRTVLGPVVRDGVISHAQIGSADEFPIGWTDVQDGGTYRLERRDDGAYFGFAVGPESWKQHLFPASVRLWHAHRTKAEDGTESFEIEADAPEAQPTALFGVRSCDLHAIAVQDRVLLEGDFADADYALRRSDVFIVAVECGTPAATCFCASMNTGPHVSAGFDIALTELLDGEHRFLARAGSSAGEQILARLETRPVEPKDGAAAASVTERAAAGMTRSMDTTDIKELLYRNLDNPRWDDVAERCLTCANCTMVCPTCFCTSIEDSTDLSGAHAERHRQWDSCFSLEYSAMGGGSVRGSNKARYRQWLTHKLASWIDQFDSSGCVGCGRCISWCPVAIDLTEEVAAIRESEEPNNAND